MRQILRILLILSVVSGCTKKPALFETIEVFTPGVRGEYRIQYRIPHIIVSKKGTVMAFAEERLGTIDDEAKENVVIRRSFDHGRNWKDIEIIKSHDNPKVKDIMTAVAADLETGRVFVFYDVAVVILPEDIEKWVREKNPRIPKNLYWFPEGWLLKNPASADSLKKKLVPGIQEGSFVISSDDEGNTWSEPMPVSFPMINPVSRDTILFSPTPGTGIQLRIGKYKGRLVIPGRGYSRKGVDFDLYAYAHNFVLYSDDHGQTWHCGGLAQTGTGEACVAELSDGSLYLNSRNESLRFRGYRAWDISHDGGQSFISSGYDTTLIEPHCHAGMVRYSYPGNGKNIVLFSNPAVKSYSHTFYDDTARKKMTLRASFDDCRTWPVSKVIDEKLSGYSALGLAADNTILCLYETSQDNKRYSDGTIVVARVNMKWLEQK